MPTEKGSRAEREWDAFACECALAESVDSTECALAIFDQALDRLWKARHLAISEDSPAAALYIFQNDIAGIWRQMRGVRMLIEHGAVQVREQYRIIADR